MSWKEDLYHEVKMIYDLCDIKLKYAMISSREIVIQLYFYCLKAEVCHMELIATNQSFFKSLFDPSYVF